MSQQLSSRWLLLVALTAIALQLCWKLLTPFLSILLWASVMVLVFYPSYRRLLVRFKGNDTAAALLTTFLVLATIILPTVALTTAVVAELQIAGQGLQTKLTQLLQNPQYSDRIPELMDKLYKWTGLSQEELRTAVQKAAQNASNWLVKGTVTAVSNAVEFLVNLGFVSFTMFYLFRDGHRAVTVLRDLLPLEREQSQALLTRAGEIISASVYGVIVLAIIQGTLGGLAFWWLGLPSPLLWGVVMILMATIPMLGTFVVWVPAAIYLAATKAFGKAIFLTFWGTIVIGMSDNLLRPRLVGQKAQMHDLLIFFSVLGGLQSFGVLGILMGPVVLAVSLTLLDAFRRADNSVTPPAAEPAQPPVSEPNEPRPIEAPKCEVEESVAVEGSQDVPRGEDLG